MRVLLDTSVLVGPSPGPIDADVAISTVSLAELHFGVLAARTPAERAERLRRVTLIGKTFDALPVDDAVAAEYGRLAAAAAVAAVAAVAAIGRQPRTRFADLLIAATAAAHQATLWTRNGADLAGLDGLLQFTHLSN